MLLQVEGQSWQVLADSGDLYFSGEGSQDMAASSAMQKLPVKEAAEVMGSFLEAADFVQQESQGHLLVA